LRQAAIAWFLAAAWLSCYAQSDGARDRYYRRIEVAFKQASVFTADSPLLEGLLQSAKSSNPAVPDAVWQSLRPELAASVTAALQDDGGATLRWLHASLDQLSDSELEHMASIYEDPVFLKAQRSMASAGAQQEAMKRSLLNALLISAGTNSVLSKHGLKEVR